MQSNLKSSLQSIFHPPGSKRSSGSFHLPQHIGKGLIGRENQPKQRMPNILDLPWHVFEDVYQELTKDGASIFTRESRDSAPSAKAITGILRLVCRQWADWLYENYLYRTMSFEDGIRATHFIAHQVTRRSKNLSRARCRSLQVINILTWGPPPPHHSGGQPAGVRAMRRKRGEVITFETLEALIELFSDSICELDLRFWNVLSLPTRTVQTIGRIENLRALTLGHELGDHVIAPQQMLFPLYDDSDDEEFNEEIRRHNEDLAMGGMGHLDHQDPLPPNDMDPDKSKIDHDCLKSLLLAARNLRSLNITDLDPISLPTPAQSANNGEQFPEITHLEVSLEGQSLGRLQDISIMLKPTLKVLSLRDSWGEGDHSQNLVPVFENFRERLEGLCITDTRALGPMIQTPFPRLSVFKTTFWDGSLSDLLEKPMFAHSPIQTLVLQSDAIQRQPTKNFRSNPFSHLPLLKQLVIAGVGPDYPTPPAYIKACKDLGIKVVCISLEDSEDFSLIMKL
ncbi:hypothetical protein MJO28_003683 [Puccinia striiformis f. sp. tritici]|uniref:Uncharacterized protein n=1 Tax=Puccinia striiformis f. sp. tritici TaxID=168172 RepID=A0ACC0ENY4_9BASI|nr:hypothetical protein MJO28_003683 [Puccinia striiformis f. sp. tritici]